MMDTSSKPETQERSILVIDANAFIRCVDMSKLSQEYDIYTTNNVLTEIRDKKAKDKFLTLNFDLNTKQCDQKSFNIACEFSKKTGDYASLSFVDKEVVALAVCIVNEKQRGHLLRKSPPTMTEHVPKAKVGDFVVTQTTNNDAEKTDTVTEETTKDNKPVDKETTLEDTKEVVTETPVNPVVNNERTPISEVTEIKEVNEIKEVTETKEAGETKETKEGPADDDGFTVVQPKKVYEEDFDDDDDDGEWINNTNLSKMLYKAKKADDTIKTLGVAIMSTDFALQNVAIQMGIPILAVDGMVIKQTRKWVLECYACHKICNIPTKEWCPACGNHTLVKLSVRYNDDGTCSYYRNPKKKINTRGQIYSIPTPSGGRKNNDLILREDELMMGNRLHKMLQMEKEKDRTFREAYQGFGNGVTFDDISRGGVKKQPNKFEFGYGKTNPNDVQAFKRKHKR
jgi:RNA-binding protein NOB1